MSTVEDDNYKPLTGEVVGVDTNHYFIEDWWFCRFNNEDEVVYQRTEQKGKYTYHYITIRHEDPNYVEIKDLL